MTGPVGILGGMFDPVHCGHLRIAIEACEALALDHVRLVPVNAPGHRSGAAATTTDRIDMLRAVETAMLRIDLREIERGGVSYTVDTLRSMREQWPDQALCLLLGVDSFRTLPAWSRPQELLGLAHIVVAARPGVTNEPVSGLDELVGNAQSERVSDLHERPCGSVYFLDLPLLPIASSDLRERCRSGRSVRHLVPDAVAEIIADRGLYTG